MAGGDQPPPLPPPPPTEEVVKQPSPTGEVVQTNHADNPNLAKANPSLTKKTFSQIVQASLGASQTLGEEENNDIGSVPPPAELKPTMTKEGNPAVVFKASDKAKYLAKMKCVLVGKFSHGRPPIGLIKEFFTGLKLKGAYNISLYDTKHLFIECALMEDFTRLWMRITWYVKGFPMRMFKWTPDFSPEKESPLTPVWIHFEGLPLYLFDDEPLLSIANSIGQPLKIDQNNIKRVKLGQASVCVAMDVSKPVRDKVWVAFEEEDSDVVLEGFWQSVSYDHYPSYCPECGHLGHSETVCKRREDPKEEVAKAEDSGSGPEKEKQATGERKETSNPPFRRVARRREKQLNEKDKGTTKAWVQKFFSAQVPDAAVVNDNPFEALEQATDQPENHEHRTLLARTNILDASMLPPPSLLSGLTLIPIPVADCLEGIEVASHPQSAPSSPARESAEGEALKEQLNKEDTVISLNEGGSPSHE
ncbi:hypothetical protein LIER_41147 [Lithospermum erythrorhizon]|uniref:DUF4283 domain-containing protein n=1 Tax=Lithospermum erythrorhizon TaxID=34254 RepID=A0AAV3R4S2_LITER